MRVTGHYDQGGRKYMEDVFSVAYQQSEDGEELEYAFIGIFDGHGGKDAALFAKVSLSMLYNMIFSLEYTSYLRISVKFELPKTRNF